MSDTLAALVKQLEGLRTYSVNALGTEFGGLIERDKVLALVREALAAIVAPRTKCVPCPEPKVYYKCFHCGAVFLDDEAAAKHFGPRDPNNPLHRREMERARGE